jgi:hypothetical protein
MSGKAQKSARKLARELVKLALMKLEQAYGDDAVEVFIEMFFPDLDAITTQGQKEDCPGGDYEGKDILQILEDGGVTIVERPVPSPSDGPLTHPWSCVACQAIPFGGDPRLTVGRVYHWGKFAREGRDRKGQRMPVCHKHLKEINICLDAQLLTSRRLQNGTIHSQRSRFKR